MARKTGITTQTAKRMALDAGAVYVNYDTESERLIGATREGSTFEVEQDVREPEIDGARGPLKGTRRVVEEHARLTVNMLEMTAENIKLALIGASITDDTDHEVVTRNLDMSAVEHVENIALVADYSGSNNPIVIKIKNPLADGNFELEMDDREEGTVEVQFTAHFDPEDLDTSPWEIRVPKLDDDNGDPEE